MQMARDDSFLMTVPPPAQPKGVFSIVYIGGFALTLISLIISFIAAGPPEFVGVVQGAVNQMVMWYALKAHAIGLSFYLLIYYIYLKIFEDRRLLWRPWFHRHPRARQLVLVGEWLLRLLVVVLVTLKIGRWEALPELFTFLTVTALMLWLWHLLIVVCFESEKGIGTTHAQTWLLMLELSNAALAGMATVLVREPDLQLEYAMLIFLILVLATLGIAAVIVVTIAQAARTALKKTTRYLSVWG